MGSLPDMPTMPCATLSTTIIPTAPAFWTFFALRTNVHVPRSTRAMFPARAAPFVIALHASVEDGPAVFAASLATTTGAVTETVAAGGPKSAVPTS